MATIGYCIRCGAVGIPEMKREGSSRLELILFFLLIIPGLIYSIWRDYQPRVVICPFCKQFNCMIPAGHPLARKALRNQ